MTLQSSGAIRMSNLRTEYTDLPSSGEVKLSDFYYGSTYLQKNTCTDAVKGTASDATKHPGYTPHFEGIPNLSTPKVQINLTDFYGKSYYYAPQTASSISGGTNQSFNPKTVEADSLKSNTINSAFIVLNTSGTINSNSTSTPALSIGTKNRSHTSVYLTNASGGRIFGKGGRGGDANSGSGSAGGDALRSEIHLFLNNNGRVFGGGGGGQASGCNYRTFKEAYCASDSSASIGGCGGGGGKGGGAGGNGAGSVCGGNFPTSGFNGSAGNSDDTGGGGAGGSGTRYADSTVDGVAIYISANSGSAGGGWGSGGGGGSGGAAGRAVVYKSGMYYKTIKTGTIAGTNGATF